MCDSRPNAWLQSAAVILSVPAVPCAMLLQDNASVILTSLGGHATAVTSTTWISLSTDAPVLALAFFTAAAAAAAFQRSKVSDALRFMRIKSNSTSFLVI